MAGEWRSLGRPLPTPPKLPAAQAPHQEVVHLVELPAGVPRPEIVPQPRSTGVSSATIRFTSFPLWRLPVNSRTRSRSFLVAFGLGHRCTKCQRGFRWMQCQTEPLHHQPDPPQCFPGPRLRATHRRQVVGIPDQNPKLATPRRPDPIQFVRVDIGQHRRDHSALRGPRQRLPHRAVSITPAPSHWRINFNTLRSEIRSPTRTINFA